jgi:hypothetical protein
MDIEPTILGVYDYSDALSQLRMRDMLRSFGPANGWIPYTELVDAHAYTSVLLDSSLSIDELLTAAAMVRQQRRVVMLDMTAANEHRVMRDARFSSLMDSIDIVLADTQDLCASLVPYVRPRPCLLVPMRIDPLVWSPTTEDSAAIVMIDSKVHYEIALALPAHIQAGVSLVYPKAAMSINDFMCQMSHAHIGVCVDTSPAGPVIFGALRIPVIAAHWFLPMIGRRGILLADPCAASVADAVDLLRSDVSRHFRLAVNLHEYVSSRWSVHSPSALILRDQIAQAQRRFLRPITRVHAA